MVLPFSSTLLLLIIIIIYYLGTTVLRCNLSCRHVSVSHYHCKHCQETILRKCDFEKHVANHSRSRSPIRVKRAVAREVHKVQCIPFVVKSCFLAISSVIINKAPNRAIRYDYKLVYTNNVHYTHTHTPTCTQYISIHKL